LFLVIDQGGFAIPCKIDPTQAEISIKSAKAVNGLLVGVDLVYWKNKWRVVETNSNPGYSSWPFPDSNGLDIHHQIASLVLESI
jgi:glutathione synthase/RimK-type ligase-like ATP-grasp enzyme